MPQGRRYWRIRTKPIRLRSALTTMSVVGVLGLLLVRIWNDGDSATVVFYVAVYLVLSWLARRFREVMLG